MKLNKREFEKEIQTALGYLIEIEDHCEEIDPDDIKDLCKHIRMPLARMLDNIQSGKIKENKF